MDLDVYSLRSTLPADTAGQRSEETPVHSGPYSLDHFERVRLSAFRNSHVRLEVPTVVTKGEGNHRDYLSLPLDHQTALLSSVMDSVSVLSNKDFANAQDDGLYHQYWPEINARLTAVADDYVCSLSENDIFSKASSVDCNTGPWAFPEWFKNGLVYVETGNSGHCFAPLQSKDAEPSAKGRREVFSTITTDQHHNITMHCKGLCLTRGKKTRKSQLSMLNSFWLCGKTRHNLVKTQISDLLNAIRPVLAGTSQDDLVYMQAHGIVLPQLQEAVTEASKSFLRTLYCKDLSSNPNKDELQLSIPFPELDKTDVEPIVRPMKFKLPGETYERNLTNDDQGSIQVTKIEYTFERDNQT